MDDVRARLHAAASTWNLSPEDQAEIVEEFAQHLEDEYRDNVPLIGEQAARERMMAQLEARILREVRVPRRHRSAIAFTPAGWLTSLRRDVLYGWRSLMRRPGLVAAAVGALAIGIGLTTLMASLVYGLLIRGLPYEGSDRIGVLSQMHPVYGPMPVARRDFVAYQQQQKSFELLGAYTFGSAVVGGGDGAERVQAYRMTPAALDLPRVPPLIGRTLRESDAAAGSEPVAVLSYALWRERFGADPAIIDSVVRIDRQPHRIVGVMPEKFGYPDNAALWRVLSIDGSASLEGDVSAIGRLNDRATFKAATVELNFIASRVRAAARDSVPAQLVAQSFVRGIMPARVYALMYAMFAAIGLVFLVACANVTNLLLDRAVHRSKEVGIRVALGASRAAVVRQFMVEALILSSIAAVGGVIIAQGGLLAFTAAMAGEEVPSWVTFSIQPPVLLFVAVVALIAASLSGLPPALLAARADINSILKDQSFGSSGHRAQRTSRILVVAQIAMSSALLLGAALMTKSVLKLNSVQPGFLSREILTGQFTVNRSDSTRQRVLLEQIHDAASRLPGAISVSLSSGSPGTGWAEAHVSLPQGVSDADAQPVRHLSVSPGFFDTYGVKLLRGRAFVEGDRSPASPVAVVNQRFVDDQFGGMDPVGQRIRVGRGEHRGAWHTIVGVVPNLYTTTLSNPWPAQVLTPLPHASWGTLTIGIRTNDNPLALVEPLRKGIASVDPDLPLHEPGTLEDKLDRSLWFVTVFGTMFIAFGFAALVLAGIGLYAVIAFSVTRREREMGIRMALGATTGHVLRVVGREGLWQVAAGTMLGLVLGTAIAQVGRAVLFEVSPHDPLMYGAVVGILALTGIAACLVPALRATRVDPVVTLRSE